MADININIIEEAQLMIKSNEKYSLLKVQEIIRKNLLKIPEVSPKKWYILISGRRWEERR